MEPKAALPTDAAAAGECDLPPLDAPVSVIEDWLEFWTYLGPTDDNPRAAFNTFRVAHLVQVNLVIEWLRGDSTSPVEAGDESCEPTTKKARLDLPEQATPEQPALLVALEALEAEVGNVSRACLVLEELDILTVRDLLSCRALFDDLAPAVEAIVNELNMLTRTRMAPISTMSLHLLALEPFLREVLSRLNHLHNVLGQYPQKRAGRRKAWMASAPEYAERLVQHRVNFAPAATEAVPPSDGGYRPAVEAYKAHIAQELVRLDKLISDARTMLSPIRECIQRIIRIASAEHGANQQDILDIGSCAQHIRQQAGKTNQALSRLRSVGATCQPNDHRDLVRRVERALLQECASYYPALRSFRFKRSPLDPSGSERFPRLAEILAVQTGLFRILPSTLDQLDRLHWTTGSCRTGLRELTNQMLRVQGGWARAIAWNGSTLDQSPEIPALREDLQSRKLRALNVHPPQLSSEHDAKHSEFLRTVESAVEGTVQALNAAEAGGRVSREFLEGLLHDFHEKIIRSAVDQFDATMLGFPARPSGPQARAYKEYASKVHTIVEHFWAARSGILNVEYPKLVNRIRRFESSPGFTAQKVRSAASERARTK